MKRPLVLAILVAFAVAIGCAPAFAAPPPKKSTGHKMYKWTDKQGVVHYGNDIPPEYADQQKEQINAQGQTIKTIDGALTPEQRAAREKAAAEEEAKKDRQQHDKVLLSTYGSVQDVERARDLRVAAIQGQISLASSAVSSLESETARLERARAGQKDPKQIEKYDSLIAAQHKQMMESQRAVIVRQDEKTAAEKAFAEDIARYRELTAPKPKP
jgi:hypothetical protein